MGSFRCQDCGRQVSDNEIHSLYCKSPARQSGDALGPFVKPGTEQNPPSATLASPFRCPMCNEPVSSALEHRMLGGQAEYRCSLRSPPAEGKCERCGGRGRLRTDMDWGNESDDGNWMPCPDCKGTGRAEGGEKCDGIYKDETGWEHCAGCTGKSRRKGNHV